MAKLCSTYKVLWRLTRNLAHTLVVVAAVSGFVTIRVAVAYGLSPRVLEAVVVPAGAAVGTVPLPAAGLHSGHRQPAQ